MSSGCCVDCFGDLSVLASLHHGVGKPAIHGNLRIKNIATARHGLDVALRIAAENLTDLDQTLDQRIISHRRVRPDGAHQFLLADEAARVFHEVGQCLERFRAKLQMLAFSHQATTGKIESESVEHVIAMNRRVHKQVDV